MAVRLTATDRLLKVARRQPSLRVKDLLAAGIRLEHLRRLHQRAVADDPIHQENESARQSESGGRVSWTRLLLVVLPESFKSLNVPTQACTVGARVVHKPAEGVLRLTNVVINNLQGVAWCQFVQ